MQKQKSRPLQMKSKELQILLSHTIKKTQTTKLEMLSNKWVTNGQKQRTMIGQDQRYPNFATINVKSKLKVAY